MIVYLENPKKSIIRIKKCIYKTAWYRVMIENSIVILYTIIKKLENEVWKYHS